MYSNEDLERFYFKYQTAALPHGQSLQSFCLNKAEKVAIFFYDNGSRGREVLTDFIGDAEQKVLMSDGNNGL